jgi:hypothetical protein
MIVCHYLALEGVLTHDKLRSHSSARFVPVCSRRYRHEMCARAPQPSHAGPLDRARDLEGNPFNLATWQSE